MMMLMGWGGDAAVQELHNIEIKLAKMTGLTRPAVLLEQCRVGISLFPVHDHLNAALEELFDHSKQ